MTLFELIDAVDTPRATTRNTIREQVAGGRRQGREKNFLRANTRDGIASANDLGIAIGSVHAWTVNQWQIMNRAVPEPSQLARGALGRRPWRATVVSQERVQPSHLLGRCFWSEAEFCLRSDLQDPSGSRRGNYPLVKRVHPTCVEDPQTRHRDFTSDAAIPSRKSPVETTHLG